MEAAFGSTGTFGCSNLEVPDDVQESCEEIPSLLHEACDHA